MSDEPLQLLLNASATLLGPLSLDELLRRVLELARKLNAAEACAIWQHDPAGDAWRVVAASGLSEEAADMVLPGSPTYSLGDQALCFEDVFTSQLIAGRREFYRKEGVRSLALVPLARAGQTIGTLVFYYRVPHRFSETEVRVMEAFGHLASAAMETAELHSAGERSRREAEQARTRSGFLAEASAVLASSLDFETTLAAVARLAVPHIADWCLVDTPDSGGRLKLLVVAHVDPEKERLAREMRARFPPDPRTPDGAAQVVRTRRPVLIPEVDDALLVRVAFSAEHLDLLRRLGCTFFMCVPLTVRERVLGAFTFVSTAPERRLGPEDLSLAEDLARRAATAMDNATLFASVQRERAALETALAALRENEDRLLMALDAGRMGIWQWELPSGVLHGTDNFERMHGFPPGGFDGRYETLLSTIHPDDRAGFQAAIDRALRSLTDLELEFRVVQSGGGVSWHVSKGRILSGDDGRPLKIVGLSMDVTERRMFEQKLREGQKLESIGLLAGGVAHDFNNLLTGILGNASLALEVLHPGNQASPLIENVVRASERAAALTQQLLAYAGKGRFVIEPLNLSSLVREITGLVNATIPKLVQLELDLDPRLPGIEGDASQLQQVVMNLVTNAAESMDGKAGTVWVTTRVERPSGSVCLEVRDEGCGMDQETQARIFDPFFTTKFTGRGLGLAAVSGIVRGHGGSIQVSSAPERGSTFRVLFPAATGVPAVKADAGKNEDLRGSGLVLLIDDEDTVRITAAAALRRYGYSVVAAQNGAEGIALFRARAPEFAAILLDLTMPVLDGASALRLIREIRPDVPVVLSSGYSGLEVSRRFAPREIAGFLQKPYTGDALARALRRALAPPLVSRQTHS